VEDFYVDTHYDSDTGSGLRELGRGADSSGWQCWTNGNAGDSTADCTRNHDDRPADANHYQSRRN